MRHLRIIPFVLIIGVPCIAGTSSQQSETRPSPDARQFHRSLSRDRQIVHALDRLTFGPRPLEADELRKAGLKKWIDLQLHPERIPESPVLQEKLKPLASLWMTQADVVRNYPTPQFIAAVAAGREKLPEDPVTRAAVAGLVQKYRARTGAAQNLDEMEGRTTVEDILSASQMNILNKGTPDQKRSLIASLDDERIDDLIVALPRPQRQQLLGFVSEDERRKIMLLNAPQAVLNYDLSEGKIFRAVYSNRQLAELMTDFWFNHFNVSLDKGADRYLLPTYERDVIRPRIFGKFRDLLGATAESPAMLFYLDNWQSVAPHPAPANPHDSKPRPRRGLNENYARELMELHTLGVDGGYTQKDVVEVARCFTGWTIRSPGEGGDFEYNDKVHDKGEKIVLGVKIPAGGGVEDGRRVLDILARHPSTARFISRKLAVRFVADNPPRKLIDRMASTFTKTDGDLRAVVKTMLVSKEFWSEGAFRAKVKTPLEMVVSAVRATNADVEYAFPLANQVAQLGEPLYRKLEPTGYSSANAEWVNSASLLGRMNFALALAQKRISGVNPRKTDLFDSAPAETRAELASLFSDNRKLPSSAVLTGLVLGSPGFQRR